MTTDVSGPGKNPRVPRNFGLLLHPPHQGPVRRLADSISPRHLLLHFPSLILSLSLVISSRGSIQLGVGIPSCQPLFSVNQDEDLIEFPLRSHGFLQQANATTLWPHTRLQDRLHTGLAYCVFEGFRLGQASPRLIMQEGARIKTPGPPRLADS